MAVNLGRFVVCCLCIGALCGTACKALNKGNHPYGEGRIDHSAVIRLKRGAVDPNPDPPKPKNDSDVRIPPRIKHTDTSHHIFYRTDSQVSLPCMASGSPAPTYEWVRNGEAINLSGQYIHWDNGLLRIDALTSLDEGYYQCKATNPYGTSVSQVFFLQRAVLGRYPPTAVMEYTVDEGMPLRLPCLPVKCLPSPTYSWQLAKNLMDEMPLPVVQSNRIILGEDGSSYFSHVTEEDEQRTPGGDSLIYKCSVFNRFLDFTTSGSPSKIIVTKVDVTNKAPTLMYSSQSPYITTKGSDVRIQCIFSGSPDVEVTWMPMAGAHTESFGTVLAIRAIQETQVCRCFATNSAGRAAVTIRVEVQSKPELMKQPFDVNATEGDTVSMDCTTKAPSDIQWSINGEQIRKGDPDPAPHTKMSNDGQRLTFYDLCRDCPGDRTDLKVVQCNASNVHGYVLAEGYLNVLLPVASSSINFVAAAGVVGFAAFTAIIGTHSACVWSN